MSSDPQVQVHDPLPEASWFWRRTFSFVFVVVMLLGMLGVGYSIHQLANAEPKDVIEKLYGMFRWLTLLTFISVTYYMVAPSAEQVTRMWQTAAMFKQGIVSTATQTTIAPDGSSITAASTTGPPAPVVVPPQPVPAPPQAAVYAGPLISDIPPPDPATPEQAQWPR